MSSEKITSLAKQDTSPELWQEIDTLVRDLAIFARSECSQNQFYSRLLDCTVRAMAALGGAVWLISEEGLVELNAQLGWNRTGLAENDDARQQHQKMLEEVINQRVEVLLPPDSSDAENMTNPTRCLLLIHPIEVDGQLKGLIEIFQRPDGTVTVQEGYRHFLMTMIELAGDFHRHSELTLLRNQSNNWLQNEQFTEQVHQNLHLSETAYRLVNEGQRLIGADRVSLLRRKGKRYQLMAVSGLEKVDRRSAVARLLEQVTARVAVTQEPLRYSGETEDLPPQIENPLQEYLELSKSRSLFIHPLPKMDDIQKDRKRDYASFKKSNRPPLADFALVVEKFDTDHLDATFDTAVDSVLRQGRLALYNALTYHNLPMRWVMTKLSQMTWFLQGTRFPKTMACLVLLTCAIGALFFIQDDFFVTGQGELQPKIEHHLFAGAEGVVSGIYTKHGKSVSKNDLLLEIRSTKLEYDLAQIEGEQQTIRAQLDALQVTLRAGLPSTAEERLKYNRAKAEQQELKVRLASSAKQIAILHEQEKELQVRSPIDGEVLTWDVVQSLQARPVNRGQKLLTVANPKGAWLLDMKIPDRQISYVQQMVNQQHQNKNDKLKLTFILATAPDVTYTLEKNVKEFQIATATETDRSGEAVVRLTVELDDDLIPRDALRPGATILPRLYCGKRSIGFIWFHDLIHVIKTKILF